MSLIIVLEDKCGSFRLHVLGATHTQGHCTEQVQNLTNGKIKKNHYISFKIDDSWFKI